MGHGDRGVVMRIASDSLSCAAALALERATLVEPPRQLLATRQCLDRPEVPGQDLSAALQVLIASSALPAYSSVTGWPTRSAVDGDRALAPR